MKLTTFEKLLKDSGEIESITNSGFDLIITTTSGKELKIEDGLPELVTSNGTIETASGGLVDYKELVEKLILDENSINTLDINFVGDSSAIEAAAAEGTGVKEGVIAKVKEALQELLDASDSELSEQIEEMTQEQIEEALDQAIESAKEQQESQESEAEQAQEKAEAEQAEEEAKKAAEEKAQAEKSNEHVEEMKNELKVEEVNTNTSKSTGEYDTPPPPTSGSSNNTGKFKEEGEPKEEDLYEFKVSLKSDSDSGSKGDFITNVGEPIFTGTGTPSTIVTIEIGGSDYSTTVDADGNWVMPPIPELEEGEHSYTAFDNAGNKVTGILVIDQTNTLTYDLENDTGSSSSDNITQDSSLVYVGTTDAGSEVTITINGKEYLTVANADGDYTLTVPDALEDGTYDVTITTEDIAGNIITEVTTVTIDTQIDATVGLSSEMDTGSSDSDEITKENENLVMAGKIEVGATASLHFNDIKYPIQIQPDGSWSVTINGELPDDSYPYRIEVTDLAGNSEDIVGTVVVDTKTHLTGGLDSSSDSGDFDNDGLTNDNQPLFSGDAEPKSVVTLTINNKQYSSVVSSDGTWEIPVVDTLPEGNHPYTIVSVDVAGNEATAKGSITVDTGVTVTASLDTDSGRSDSDKITNVKNSTISGKTEAGATGTISLNGGQPVALDIKADGSFIYQTGDLDDGEYHYTINVTDLAGNTDEFTDKFTVDTITAVKGGLDSGSDTGESNADGETSNNKPTFSGTGEPKAEIQLLIDNTTYLATVGSDGTWTVDVTNPLPEGDVNYTIIATDVAGNEVRDTGKIHVDTVAPTGFTANLVNDSGSDSSDWNTKNGALQFSGSVEAGCDVKIKIDGKTYTTADGIVVNPDGSWSFDLPTTLTHNIYPVEFIAIDTAGNQDVIKQDINVDTKTMISGGLDESSDSGESSSDNITNKNEPIFSGNSEPNSDITVTLDKKTYQTTSDAQGNWHITSDLLTDGDYTVTMTVTDAAGNTETITEDITVDTVAPALPTISLKNDTGLSGKDFITKSTEPSLQGTSEAGTAVKIEFILENGDKFTYTEPDIVVDEKTGEWSFISPITFPDGVHTINVISTDKAGNDAVASQDITVDTQISLTGKLDSSDDSGVQGDKITNEQNPTFVGTGTEGDQVTLRINGNAYTTTVDQNGEWSIRVTDMLPHSPSQPYDYEIVIVDKAGNTTSKNDSITIDSQTKVTGGLDSTSDSRAIDGVTSDNTPLFSGTGEVGAEITLEIDSKFYTATVDSKGGWSIPITTSMVDDVYSYSIKAVDHAGNEHVIHGSIEIDTVTSVSGGLDATSDSGAADSITKHDTPYFSGSGEEGSTVTVTINSKTYTTVVDVYGEWKVQVTEALPDGDYSYVIKAVDIAGNESTLPQGTIEIDTSTYLTGGLSAGFDTGRNSSDNITSFDQPQFSGTGEKGATITLDIDGRSYNANVNQQGVWEINNVHKLSDGDHIYDITIVDVAGNTETMRDTLTVDTTAPVFVKAKLENDTGTSDKDMITKDGNVVLVGEVEDSTVEVEVSIDGSVYRSPDDFVVDSDGTWRFVLPTPLTESATPYNFTITYTDVAGNSIDQTGSIFIDETNTITGGLDSSMDSGDLGDKLTNETKPLFSGVTEPNSKITLTIDNQVYTAVADSKGEWSIAVGHNLTDGDYPYEVVSIDVAGNEAVLNDVVKIDTTPSSLTSIDLDNDSGLDGDWITKNSNPQWSGKLEVGSELVITVTGSGVSETLRSPDDFIIAPDGSFTVSLGTTLSDGEYKVTFDAVDAAGNKSLVTHDLEVDTQIFVTGGLDAGSDTGEFNNDNITKEKNPVMSGTGEAGGTVTVTINAKDYQTQVLSDGTWKLTVTDVLPDNDYPVTIQIVDVAGNKKNLPTFTLTVDNTPPAIHSVAMVSDTGDDANDGLTKENSPVFEGRVEAGCKVEIEIDGVRYTVPPSSVDALGNWSFTIPTDLDDGAYTWDLYVTDDAGNVSHQDGDIEVDTENTLTGSLAAASDTGESSSDGLTNEKNPTFDGKTDPHSKVTLRFSNGDEYTTTANSSGFWSIDAKKDLTSGTHNYDIISVDPAGNEKVISGDIEVDLDAPAVTITLVSDTGHDSNDGVTKSKSPVFSGTSESGSEVEVILGGITYGEPSVKVNKDGTWSFALPVELSDGKYRAEVRATDAAGNATVKFVDIEIDNTVYINGGLSRSSDTGASDSDGISRNPNPDFSGKGESGSKVTLVINGYTYSDTVDSNDDWSINVSDALPEGNYPYQLTIVDAAGNSKVETGDITIDFTAELTARLDAGSDSGRDDSDNITNQNKPLFSGMSEEDAEIVITINNVSKSVIVGAGGSWTMQWDTLIPDGVHPVKIDIVDVAGNKRTLNQSITVDTVKPEIPSVTLDNDTGLDGSDGVTNEDRPEFSGQVNPGEKVTFLIDNRTYTSPDDIVIDQSGAWSFKVPVNLDDDTYNFTVIVEDEAGNASTFSDVIEVDTQFKMTAALDDADDSGVKGDYITSERNPTFKGVAEDSAEIVIRINNNIYTTQANQDGSWSFEIPDALPHGVYKYTIEGTDVAGNTEVKNGEIEIDTATQISGGLDTASDSGVKGDLITNSEKTKFSGNGEAGSDVVISIGGVTYDTKVDDYGVWSFTVPVKLTEGNHPYIITSTDAAGNKRVLSDVLVIDRTNHITASMKSTSDSGVDDSDGITNEKSPTFSGQTQVGSEVRLVINGSITYTIPVNTDGSFEFTIPSSLTDGDYSYKFISEDTAGNVVEDTGNFTIDTVAIHTGGLDDADDTGLKNDDLTKNERPTISGSGEVGAEVIVVLNGKTYSTTVDTNGQWSIEVPVGDELSTGTYPYTIKTIDLAGNKSVLNKTLHVDTSTFVTAQMITDSGGDAHDGVTSENCPSFTGTMEVGSTISITIGLTTYTEADGITVNSNGTWSFTVPAQDYLSDGSHNWSVNVVDDAGNVDADQGVIVVDTTDPTALTVKLDNGTVSDDEITGEAKPQFSGASEAGTTIQVKVNGVVQPDSSVVVQPDGSWVFEAPTKLPEGHYVFEFISTDAAGNSQSMTHNLEIDTSNTVAGGLNDSTDSGTKGDKVTNSQSVKLSGSGEVGADIEVEINNKTYTTAVQSDGTWELTIPDLLPEGNHPYSIKSTDAAGIVHKITDTVEVDRTNTITAGLKASSDTGSDKSDGITHDKQPTFVGQTQAGSTVQLVINGSTTYDVTVDSDGSFEFQVPSTMPDGDYTYKFTSIDAAGNSVSDDGTITIDTHAELTVKLDSSSDTGTSGDRITSDKTPTISGSGEEGTKITLLINSKTYTTTVDQFGEWSITLPPVDALPDGDYPYSVTAVDIAGNTTVLRNTVEIDKTIDVTGELKTDTGSNSNDGITQSNQPTFGGTMDAGDTITFTLNNKIYDENSGVTVNANGTWSFTVPPSDQLPDDTYVWRVDVVDAAGNADYDSGTIVVDTTDPNELTVGLLNGSVQDDSITKEPKVSFGGQSEAGTAISVVMNGQLQPSSLLTVNPDGTWTFTAGSDLPDGDYKFEFISTDTAGNSQTIVHNIEVDTSTHLTGGLDSSCDTGDNTADGVTNSKNLLFSGTGESGAEVILFINKSQFTATVAPDGTWKIPVGELDGTNNNNYPYKIQLTDAAGNVKTVTGDITVDTVAPVVPVFELADASDSSTQDDWITKSTSVVLSGVGEVDSKITVMVGSTPHSFTVDDSGTWTLDLGKLDEGHHIIVVTSEDAAGNKSTHTETLLVDRSIALEGGLDADHDTGLSKTDKYTSDVKPVFSGSTDPLANVTVTISIAGGSSVVLTTQADANGLWETDPSQYPEELTDGVFNFKVDSVDAAGNTATFSDTMTIDTQISVGIKLDDSTNSKSLGDDITNNPKPRFSGTGQANDEITVNIYDQNGISVITMKATVATNGTWYVDVPSKLDDGSYRVVSTSLDKAGNTIGDETTVTIDTTKPTGLSGGLDDSTNTGTNNDTITKNNKPKFSGNVEAGCEVKLVFDNGVTHQAVVDKNGNWEFQVTTVMPDGIYKYTIVAEDAAGNTTSQDAEITIDNTIAFTGYLAAGSDTGWSDTDYHTKENNPVFEGKTDPFSEVKVTLNAIPPKVITTQADQNGDFSIALGELMGSGGVLPEGSHSVTFTATDPAGNTKSFTETLVVDTTRPTNVAFSLDSDSDSGSKGDFITSDKTPTIKGTCEFENVKLTVRVDSVNHDVKVQSDGTWVFAIPELSDGDYEIKVTAEDKAGNKTVKTETITIDTEAPTGSTGRLAADSDEGEHDNDGITNKDTNLRFEGMVEPKATIVLEIKGKQYPATVGSDGGWVVTIPDHFDDGDYIVTMIVTDEAGNENKTETFNFEVDTVAPTLGGIGLKNSDDTGDKGDDTTNKPNPHITGNVSTDVARVWITIDGTSKTFDATVNPDGTWSCQLNGLGEGTHTYTVHAVDVAGNETDMPSNVVTIDTTNNVDVRLAAGSDSGSDNTDGITNDTKPTIEGSTDVGNDLFLTIKDKDGTPIYTDSIYDSGATYRFEVSTALPQGEYTIEVLSVDSAGNQAVAREEIVIDTVSHADVSLHASSDTGVVGDNMTKEENPKIGGDAEPFSEISIDVTGLFGGSHMTKTYTTTADSKGAWIFTLPDNLSDGTYNVSVVATDKAGNVSAPATVDFVVDTTPPVASGDILTDSGSDTGDGITSGVASGAKQGHLDFAGTTSGGATKVILAVGGRTYNITPEPDGSWTFVVPDKLADNTYTYSISAEDAAGNISTPVTGTVTLDTKIVTMGSLDNASDSGEKGDNVTNKTKPVISGSGEAGLMIVASISGNGMSNFPLGTIVTEADGSWELDLSDYLSAPLTDGTYTIHLDATDLAGNNDVIEYRFEVDTTPPDVTLNAYNGGEVTTDMPKISGKGEVGATIFLVIDNEKYQTTVGADSNWEFSGSEMPSLPDGVVEYKVYSIDAAGNRSADVKDTVVINTGTYVDGWLDSDSDTGLLDSDGVTQNRTPVFKGNGESGGDVTVVIKDENGNPIGTYTTVVAKNGLWELQVPADEALPDGRYTYDISILDASGNVTSTEPADLVVDNSVALQSLNAYSPSYGGRNYDGIWYVGSGSVYVRGQLKNNDKGAEVKIVIDGQEYVGVTDKNGNFSILMTLPDGQYEADITITDVAGNTMEQSMTIDVDSVADWTLVSEDDVTGDPKNWVVNSSRPTFSGDCDSDSALIVTLELYGLQNFTIQGTISNGTWTIVPDQDIPDGTYSYRVVYQEKSGRWVEQRGTIIIDTTNEIISLNEMDKVFDEHGDWEETTLTGFGEPNSTITVILDGVEYHTTVDAGGIWTVNVPITSNGDYTLNVKSVDVAGNEVMLSPDPDNTVGVDFIEVIEVDLEDGEVISPDNKSFTGKGDAGNSITVVFVDDQGREYTKFAAVQPDGTWTVDIYDLPDGNYTYTVTATSDWDKKDVSGNIEIDATAPIIESIELSTDSGIVGDNITNDKQPTISGKVEAGTHEVKIVFGGITYVSGTDFVLNSDGTFSFEMPTELDDGNYLYSVSAIDEAGNTTTVDSNVVIDTTKPEFSLLELETLQTTSEGKVVTVANPELSGTIEGDISEFTITVDGTVLTEGTDFVVNPDGTWAVNMPTDLTEGAHKIDLYIVDAAGNETVDSIEFIVDTIAPTIESVTLDTDSGDLGDGVTNESKPVFSGKVEAGTHEVKIVFGTVTYVSGVDFTLNPDGTFTFTTPMSLDDGEYLFEVIASDEAGNSTSFEQTIVIDTAVPVLSEIVLEGAVETDDGIVLGNVRPELSGKLEGEVDDMTVTIDGVELVAGTDFFILPNGTWSLDVPSDLTEGEHKIEIRAVDKAGNEAIEVIDFVVDTTPPQGTGGLDADQNDFTDPDTITNGKPVFSGTGEVGATVTVTIGNSSYSTVVDEDGNWVLEYGEVLPDDKHLYVIELTDAAGNTSQIDFDMIHVDSTAAAPPAMMAMASVDESELSEDVVLDKGSDTISGTAEYGEVIQVELNGQTYEAGADFNGAWALEIPKSLENGEYPYVATRIAEDGSVSTLKKGVVTAKFEEVSDAPAVDVEVTEDATTLSGHADAGSDVTVEVDGVETIVKADDNGDWSLSLDADASGISVTLLDGGEVVKENVGATEAANAPSAPHAASMATGVETELGLEDSIY